MGDGEPNCSDSCVGIARKSASFGGGAFTSGDCFNGPGTGGKVTKGEAPPAPKPSALGPRFGGRESGGPPTADLEKSSSARRWIACSIAIAAAASTGPAGGGPSRVVMIAADIDVLEHAESVVSQDRGRAI